VVGASIEDELMGLSRRKGVNGQLVEDNGANIALFVRAGFGFDLSTLLTCSTWRRLQNVMERYVHVLHHAGEVRQRALDLLAKVEKTSERQVHV